MVMLAFFRQMDAATSIFVKHHEPLRSEEHIRNWGRYDPAAEQGILPLESIVKVFSGKFMQKRLDSNYVSHALEYFGETVSVISKLPRCVLFGRPPSFNSGENF